MKPSRLLPLTCVAIASSALLSGCSLLGDSGPSPSPSVTVVASAPAATPSVEAPASASPSPSPSSTYYGPPSKAPVSTSTTAGAAPVAATKKPTPTARVDPNAPKGQCTDKNMLTSVQQDENGGGDGQRRAFVVIENIGNSTCTLRGYPGVSLVGGGNGTQIGHAASKIDTNTSPKTIQVGRGDYVVAILNYVYIDKNEKTFSDGKSVCNAKHADGYRVYPPHSFNSVFTAYDTYACSGSADWIAVGAIELNHYDFTPELGK